MNIYPGSGLGIATAVLGSSIGRTYPTWAGFTYCTVHGVLLTPLGTPAGRTTRTLSQTMNGTELTDGWQGVTVSASHSPAETVSGKIIGAGKIETTTNSAGYFEINVIKGLTVVVTCPDFGTSVTVDTTGHDTIDISSSF